MDAGANKSADRHPTLRLQADLLYELEQIPPEFLPAFLKLVRAFREGVTLPTAQDSFRQGWKEALGAETRPVSELWEDLDVE